MRTTLTSLAIASQLALSATPTFDDSALQQQTSSIVAIRSFRSGKYDETQQKTPEHQSQGFMVEDNGFVLTAYQSLLNKSNNKLLQNITVSIAGDKKSPYPAQIVAVEPTLNFAILKIESDKPFTTTKIASKQVIQVGTRIFTYDNYPPNSNTKIKGEILSLNSMECYQENMSATMLKADITLHPSLQLGTPVFNEQGEVISIYTNYQPVHDDLRKEEEETGEYLLPISLAFNIYESIKQKQSFVSPWTGFSVRPTSRNEQSIFPFKRFTAGLAIDEVWPNSPAQKLGIQPGDILVRFAHYATPNEAEFQKWLYMYGVGAKIKLHLIRNKTEYLTLDYKIEPRPKWAIPK